MQWVFKLFLDGMYLYKVLKFLKVENSKSR